MWRDLQEQPLLTPLMNSYNSLMSIKRYEQFPFYVKPMQTKVAGFEDTVLVFFDHLVDAHELERNKADHNKSFYYRASYVARNFHRYSNDTMANLMFDTKLRKTDYDRMNSVLRQSNYTFYATATFTHVALLSYASYFLRYRTLGKA